jgi:hypothetical protein
MWFTSPHQFLLPLTVYALFHVRVYPSSLFLPIPIFSHIIWPLFGQCIPILGCFSRFLHLSSHGILLFHSTLIHFFIFHPYSTSSSFHFFHPSPKCTSSTHRRAAAPVSSRLFTLPKRVEFNSSRAVRLSFPSSNSKQYSFRPSEFAPPAVRQCIPIPLSFCRRHRFSMSLPLAFQILYSLFLLPSACCFRAVLFFPFPCSHSHQYFVPLAQLAKMAAATAILPRSATEKFP